MEKLWTTTEAAQYLGVTEAELGRLVQAGRLTGYKLGGKFLRFRPDQVKQLKPALGEQPARAAAEGGPAREEAASWRERLRDFVYFYDLYLVSGGLLLGLVVYLVAAG